MGVFFEKVKQQKSSKPVYFIKMGILLAMFILLVASVMRDLDIYCLKLVFVLASATSIVDGVESYFETEGKKAVLTNLGIGFIYLMVGVFI